MIVIYYQECSKLVSSTTVTVPSSWPKQLEGREIYLGLWSQCVQSIMARRASFQGVVHITVVRKKKERVCSYCKPFPLIPSFQTPVYRWCSCTQHGSFLLCIRQNHKSPVVLTIAAFFFLEPKLKISFGTRQSLICDSLEKQKQIMWSHGTVAQSKHSHSKI